MIGDPSRFEDGSHRVLGSDTVLHGASGEALASEIEALAERLARARAEIGNIIFGQEEVVDQAIVTLLSGGHAVLIGVPGLGKTRLVETLGAVFGLDEKRVQFTPDLMPDRKSTPLNSSH